MFKETDYKELPANMIDMMGKTWALISGGDDVKFNMMTASWGGFGFLWNKPVATIYIRPQRYTLEFIEKRGQFTLSFLPEKCRQSLAVCGSVSGRDADKLAESRLTPWFTPSGTPAFEEADVVVECKTLYRQFMTADSFDDKALIDKWYPIGDFHKMLVGEIKNVWLKV